MDKMLKIVIYSCWGGCVIAMAVVMASALIVATGLVPDVAIIRWPR